MKTNTIISASSGFQGLGRYLLLPDGIVEYFPWPIPSFKKKGEITRFHWVTEIAVIAPVGEGLAVAIRDRLLRASRGR